MKTIPHLTLKATVRFCNKIAWPDHKEPSEKCWVWTGEVGTQGYGIFWYGSRQYLAHRVSYRIHHADNPPKGLLICHRCDNRLCVNPNHFFLGTHADNFRDMCAKGRARYGERNCRSKLKHDDVLEIRRRLKAGETGRSISKDFNVAEGTISAIKTKRVWGHV